MRKNRIALDYSRLKNGLYQQRLQQSKQNCSKIYTNKTALIHPSFSGLLVTCAYFPHTTLPVGVTKPKSATLTSIIVPFVMTP